MKIMVFGSTGGIGKQVVEQALEAGHTVTALARNPSDITNTHPMLNVVEGDALKADTFQDAVAGQDAVVSTLGIRNAITKRGPTVLYSQGNANIILAMQAAGVRRLVCVSASGLDPANPIQHAIFKPLLWFVAKHMYEDLVRMETIVQQSELDWTIIRPPYLSNGPRTGRYHSAVNRQLTDGWALSRADLAEYVVSHLRNPETFCGMVEVAQ